MSLQSIITAIIAFASTNIDDIFLLMLFYSSRRFSNGAIVTGQYLGISVLVILSFIGAFAGSFFDERYVGLLGLFPIYLAIKDAIELYRGEDDEDENVALKATGFWTIAGVTVANGGDNVGVYIPLLTTMSSGEKIQLVIIFALATYLWCRIAQYLAFHPLIAKKLAKYGHIVTPIVLFLLGVFILLESGTFSLIGG